MHAVSASDKDVHRALGVAPAGAQTIPSSISSGPESSRSRRRRKPGVCSRSMWCLLGESRVLLRPSAPEAECSSSRRFITTGVVVGKRSLPGRRGRCGSGCGARGDSARIERHTARARSRVACPGLHRALRPEAPHDLPGRGGPCGRGSAPPEYQDQDAPGVHPDRRPHVSGPRTRKLRLGTKTSVSGRSFSSVLAQRLESLGRALSTHYSRCMLLRLHLVARDRAPRVRLPA